MGDSGSGFLSEESRYAGFLRRDCTGAPGSFNSSSPAGLYPIKILLSLGSAPSVSGSTYLSGACGTLTEMSAHRLTTSGLSSVLKVCATRLY